MATEIVADDKALREARRERALDAMAAHDIDVLLLGREANARYVSGAPRLWTAGTRPYGPGCVLVRATGAVHLVSTWDEGIPDDIPHENLFGITWNPGNLFTWLQGIEGVSDATRIGTDSLTPRFAAMLPKLFPAAAIVDAEPALEAARRIKTPEEIDAIRASIAVAEKALAWAMVSFDAGVTVRHLAAAFMEEMARQGVTTPATQRVAWITSDPRPYARRDNAEVTPTDVVAFDAGVVADGYTGEVGRTWPASLAAADDATRELFRRADGLWDRLLAACTAGASCRGLLTAYEAAGVPPPATPIAWGLGLGFDTPVVDHRLPQTAADERLEAGMVLAVVASVDGDGRSVFRKDAVLITHDGPEVLTSSPHWRP
jgi:Xaa-Pro aminopeptidase